MAVMLRVRSTLTYGSGGPGLNTIYWLPGTPGGSTADATDAVARVRACWQSAIAQFAASMSIQVQSQVDAIDDVLGTLVGSFSGTAVAAVVGTGGANNELPAAQVLVRSRTALIRNGRLVKGRSYVGPVAATVASSLGMVSAGSITAFNTAFNGLLAAGVTASVPGVWHRPSPAGAGGFAAATSYSTWEQFAVLRSRRDA